MSQDFAEILSFQNFTEKHTDEMSAYSMCKEQ